ncbi:iron chelate uptake ABC transporter family permease subunit, partial [Rhizobium sp. SIMBA_035]
MGSTAGMLYTDALGIAGGGAAVLFLVLLTRRPMTMVAFDPEYAAARGLPVSKIDMLMMGLVMAVTVVGLKVVGLIL